MRARALLLSAIALSTGAIVLPAHAQGLSPVAPHPVFGAMAGLNFSKLGGDDVDDVSRRTAFIGGVYMDLQLGRPGLLLHPELLYSQKGTKTDLEELSDATLRLDYIEVPVLVRYEFPTSGSVRPFVSAGPSIGFQVKCDAKGKVNGGDVTADCDAMDVDNQSVDFSAIGDLGVQFRTGTRLITIGGRYTHGFSDVIKDVDAKNRTFALYLGVGF